MPLPRRRTLAGIATLGATVALIAGCGGGDSSALSAAEWRSQADAVCADTDRQVDALAEPTAPDQLLTFLRAGLPIQQAQLDKLRDLEAPDELKSDADAALGLLEQQITAVTAAADRIEAGEDPEAVIAEVDSEISSLGDQADAKAEELGLTVCGDDSSSSTTESTATAPVVPTTTSPAADTTDSSTGTGDTAAYVADVQQAAGALQEFGTLLQNSTGLEDLRSKIPSAQQSLDEFDSAIAELDGYTLETAELERQRSGLVRTGPAVSDVLRRFLDAADEGDLAAVQALVPEVTSTITEFQKAATG